MDTFEPRAASPDLTLAGCESTVAGLIARAAPFSALTVDRWAGVVEAALALEGGALAALDQVPVVETGEPMARHEAQVLRKATQSEVERTEAYRCHGRQREAPGAP